MKRKPARKMKHKRLIIGAIIIIIVVIVATIAIYIDYLNYYYNNVYIYRLPNVGCNRGNATECFLLASNLYQNRTGFLNLVLAQTTGTTQFNISIVCTATTNKEGLPYAANGNPNATYIGTLQSSQTYEVNGLECYNSEGHLVHGLPQGTYSIWETYYNATGGKTTTLAAQISAFG